MVNHKIKTQLKFFHQQHWLHSDKYKNIDRWSKYAQIKNFTQSETNTSQNGSENYDSDGILLPKQPSSRSFHFTLLSSMLSGYWNGKTLCDYPSFLNPRRICLRAYYTLKGEDLNDINVMSILIFTKWIGRFRVNSSQPSRLDYLGITKGVCTMDENSLRAWRQQPLHNYSFIHQASTGLGVQATLRRWCQMQNIEPEWSSGRLRTNIHWTSKWT